MGSSRPPDDEMQDFLRRMEREFHAQSQPPHDEREGYAGLPVVEAAPHPPQRVRLTLPLARPRLVFALLAANVVMYGLTLLLSGQVRLPYQDAAGNQYIDAYTAALSILGAKENELINMGQWWRLLTPMVLHGSLTHLLFNSWALYALGTEAERVYGTLRFSALYLLSGLAGSIASYMFNPGVLSVGASGAIFGLLGALAAFAFTSRSLIGWESSRMQLGQMATLVVINLALGFAVPNIDNSAHIGGLGVGGLAGLALAPRYAVERTAYSAEIARRDPPLVGWGVAAVLLVVLVAWFVMVRPV